MNTKYFSYLISILFLASCGLAEELVMPAEESPAEQSAYTLIYYIHGDSDYLYHDKDGNAIQADKHILREAKMLAKMARTGEVFIFHQGRKPLIGGFSGRMYHFRFGENMRVLPYSPLSSGDGFFSAESALFRERTVSVKGDEHRSFFLFFGHEIPEEPNSSYHATHDGMDVGITTFADGLKGFKTDEDRFELVVLSSCSNGQPAVAEAIRPLAKGMIASPQNLHLSYLRPLPLILLEPRPDIPSQKLAERIAEVSFSALSRSVQTTVTISYYDLDETASYISSLTEAVKSHAGERSSQPAFDKTDCGTLPFFDSDLYTAGVRTWYRPSRFGRPSGETHSGWGCVPK